MRKLSRLRDYLNSACNVKNKRWVGWLGVAKILCRKRKVKSHEESFYLRVEEPRALWRTLPLTGARHRALRLHTEAMGRDQPISNIRTMDQSASESIALQRLSILLSATFAGVALLLAAVGIYGVMSYSVTQRRSEFGIRMALGAQKRDVLKLTIGKALKLVLLGVVFGLAGAFALTRLMASLLFGVGATDPATFAAISLVLVGVGFEQRTIRETRAERESEHCIASVKNSLVQLHCL